VIAETVDVNPSRAYAKERALIEEVKAQLARGRKCQVFAVYANKHDVIERLEGCFGTTHTGSHLACRRSHSQAGRHGTGSNCAVELMWRFAIPRSSRPGWICWTLLRFCFPRRAIYCTRCVSPAGGHGVSGRGDQWRLSSLPMQEPCRRSVYA